MKDKIDSTTFKKAVKSNSVFWRKHVIQRMIERDISQSDVLEALLLGEVIKVYEDDKPFPSILILHFFDKRPLHVLASMDTTNNTVYIITAYEPSTEIFEKDFKTKRADNGK